MGILDSRLGRKRIQGVAGVRVVMLTLFALIAFAANSIICRMALGSSVIDPASFSTIRLASGALALLVIARIHSKKSPIRHPGTWMSAAMLFLYAVSFSFAYVIWYAALQNLSTTRAATVQLFVPIIAAFGGVLFLSERITLRLILAAILIIGGVGLTLVVKNR